ncbi:hypothetical protein HQN89_28270 [Paenibacillus frigoriresistens]|uniref:hypothetical protein n=1 Tax=Paenibacillus alginolyticus TaxID=59839 RepID=UPI001563A4EA|nr:hypothetical protein [Paenibacillus frigoriresistens]NRF94793.1 hypothetical protein [Paenibacillus frigoriresistens]
MFSKRNYVPLVMLVFILALTACGGRDKLTNISSQTVAPQSLPKVPHSSNLNSSPIVTEENTVKEDDSIRAIGTHPDGRLIVRPVSNAKVATLGAPSCYGLETDFRWSGEYEVVWESTSNGISSKVMTFPIEFEIVQQDDAIVKMIEFTLGEEEIFAYVPRYSDCHALETYFFGVRVGEGTAFPISIEMKPEQILTNISQLPHRPFQVSNGELILTGGYGAGQDFINVYHFHYDSKKRSMILKSTDRVKPTEIVYDK